MALTVGLAAGPGVCAPVAPPVPQVPVPTVDFTGEAAVTATATTAQGQKLDTSSVLTGAQQLANDALKAADQGLGAAGAVADGALGDSAPISNSDLGSATGGSTNVLIGAVTDQTLSATNTDNAIHANSITNGALNISPNAFNFSGVGNFVMNTGNQNNVQGNLSVTIVELPGLK
ncbi:MAG: hypothetical protein JO127_17650 [Caulobacteraceae bacterium]|nr:hypothetical protein [Caulobacteraceae bacterium]